MSKKWKLLSVELAFDTPFIKIERRSYQLPTGEVRDNYYHLKRPDYVLVVAHDQSGKILVVKQYRRGIDREIIELPAGWIDDGETPEQAALRELFEETGVNVMSAKYLGVIAAQPAFSDMQGHVVAVEIPELVGFETWSSGGNQSDDEHITRKLVSKSELDEFIKNGDFCSMGDLAALKKYELLP
jgi:8-oxo-dGTP pyrophosphatase MutT (NUDIX family)